MGVEAENPWPIEKERSCFARQFVAEEKIDGRRHDKGKREEQEPQSRQRHWKGQFQILKLEKKQVYVFNLYSSLYGDISIYI